MEWLMPYRDPGGEHGYRCPVAEAAVGEVLSLPLWPGIETATIDRVVNALGESLNQACREEV
jgi:dTDP-4-amino-4,6-dideoxygalactose transaminase